MSLAVSLKPPVTGTPPPKTKLPFPVLLSATSFLKTPSRRRVSLSGRALRPPKAVEESKEETSEESGVEVEGREIGAEIRKAMEERKSEKEGKGETMSFSGVAEEIGEIEWPGFGKVLGTTGVVLGVIAGSSVVLLTVNAVLAELSDRVFAGKGVQDFFS